MYWIMHQPDLCMMSSLVDLGCQQYLALSCDQSLSHNHAQCLTLCSVCMTYTLLLPSHCYFPAVCGYLIHLPHCIIVIHHLVRYSVPHLQNLTHPSRLDHG